MDAWQAQCRGDSFRVGSRVVWTLAEPDIDWLGTVFGPLADTVTHSEERHSDKPLSQTTSDVLTIRAVYCRYAPLDDTNLALPYPVKGSAVLSPVAQATGWENREEGLSHAGYLDEFTVADAD